MHLGPSAMAIERRAKREEQAGSSDIIHSDIAEINKEIRKHNRLVKELMQQLDKEIARIRQDEQGQQDQQRIITDLQQKLQTALTHRDLLERERIRILSNIETKGKYIKDIRSEIRSIEKAIDNKRKKIKELGSEVTSVRSKKQKNIIREAITNEQETLITLQNYLESQKARYRMDEINSSPEQVELYQLEQEQNKLAERIEAETATIEETSEMLQALDAGVNIGSEAITMTVHGAVDLVHYARSQEQQTGRRRR